MQKIHPLKVYNSINFGMVYRGGKPSPQPNLITFLLPLSKCSFTFRKHGFVVRKTCVLV